MFKYELEINPDEMLVKIVPSLYLSGFSSGQRKISYKDAFGRLLFFKISNFPDYLRCEDFPWERLKNLNEVVNFITMYEQYNELIKIPESPIYQPAFVGTSSFKYDLGWTTSTIQVDPYNPLPYRFSYTSPPGVISCSCLCSRDR